MSEENIAATHNFKDFTNKFPLTKTLRFELVPHELTRRHIHWDARDAGDVFPEERARNAARPHIKQAIDELFVEFTADALSNLRLDQENVQRFIELEIEIASENNKREIKRKRAEQRSIQKELAEEIGCFFNGCKGNERKGVPARQAYVSPRVGGKSKAELLGKEVIDILKEQKREDTELMRHISAFDRFFTGLGDLKLNREHYFEGSTKSGTIAARIVKDNLSFFAQNIVRYRKKYEPVANDLRLTDEEKRWFTPDAFQRVLTQEGIEAYNMFIGGEGVRAGEVSGDGLNKRINEYNQRLSKDEKHKRLPLMKQLYQQIGTQKELRFEALENDADLLRLLEEIGARAPQLHLEAQNFFNRFFDSLESGIFDLERIYISKRSLRTIAQEILSEWAAFNELFKGKRAVHTAYTTLEHLRAFIETQGAAWRSLTDGDPITWEKFVAWWRSNVLARIDGGEVRSAVAERTKETFLALDKLEDAYHRAIDQLRQAVENGTRPDERAWGDMVRAWREYLEAYIEIARLSGVFRLRGKTNNGVENFLEIIPEDEKDAEFYADWERFDDTVRECQPQRAFNKIRNYLTKLRDHQKELRVYFAPGFLGGWSRTKLDENLGAFLRNDRGEIFLAVLNGAPVHVLDNRNDSTSSLSVLLTQSMGDPSKDIPNLMVIGGKTVRKTGRKDKVTGVNTVLEQLKKDHLPTNIYSLIQRYGYGRDLRREVIGDQIDEFVGYYKARLIEYHQKRGTGLVFHFKERYDSYDDFVSDVRRQAYSARWQTVDERLFYQKVDEGSILLFRICNKDLCSARSQGKQNIHTILFRTLLSDENINQGAPFRLGGAAKVFLRDASQKNREKIVTKSGVVIEKEADTPYHKQRFLDKKLLFHVPVSINATVSKVTTDKDLTEEINRTLLNVPRAVIGIDRGEKHLLYWSLIGKDGRYVDGGSLNVINGTNYAALLEERERERREARQQWRAVEGIARLKEGYLSHVIHFIVSKALEHDAVVVLEDLNFRFMQKRGGQFERSVYQQFQKALLEKLQFVVDKNRKTALNVPQLSCMHMGQTDLSLKDLRGQHGITFFVGPEYTSATCPECGWRKDIYINYKNVDATRTSVSERVKSIRYNSERDEMEIVYTREHDGSDLVLHSGVDRLRWDTVNRRTISISAHELTRALSIVLGEGAAAGALPGFGSAVIGMGTPIHSGNNVIDEMLACDDATTWKAFVYYFNTLLQIRNHYRAGEEVHGEVDFLHCPRCGFDTRSEGSFLKNGDAVGAYNIARKGHIALDQIRNSSTDGTNPDLYVKTALWDGAIFQRSDR